MGPRRLRRWGRDARTRQRSRHDTVAALHCAIGVFVDAFINALTVANVASDRSRAARSALRSPSERLPARRPVHNLVISNVPGPQVPLYFLGCQVKAMYPLGPIFHGTGLNITVMSLTGKLDVGINSCWELVPDVWDLADDFEVALQELLTAAA